jgi:hypothetical protein
MARAGEDVVRDASDVMLDIAPPTADLCLGGTSPNKVIHHSTCRHARVRYGWARQFNSVRALCDELARSGAWRWHRFCRYCCQEFVDGMNDAMTREQDDDA